MPARFLRRPTRQAAGQSLVETALILPVFLLTLFGLIDVGRLVYTNAALSQASREGARLGAAEAAWVGRTDLACVSSPSAIGAGNPGAHVCPPNVAALKADVLAAVNRMTVAMTPITTVHLSCNAGATVGDPAPSGNWTEGAGGNGCMEAGEANASAGYLISVRLEYDYNAITPIISSIIGSVPLSGSTTMVVN